MTFSSEDKDDDSKKAPLPLPGMKKLHGGRLMRIAMRTLSTGILWLILENISKMRMTGGKLIIGIDMAFSSEDKNDNIKVLDDDEDVGYESGVDYNGDDGE